MTYRELIYRIRGCTFEVYKHLGPGLLESAYEAAMMHELATQGLRAQHQVTLPLVYKDLKIDNAYRLDILVEDSVILELKSVKALTEVHQKQLLNYLKLTELPIGLLINFDVSDIKDGIVSVVNNYEQYQEIKK